MAKERLVKYPKEQGEDLNKILKLLFVGDVMLGRLVNDCLKEEPFEYPWGDTLDIFESADVRFCNLECAIANNGEPWTLTRKVFHFRSDSKNVAVLKKAGIDCVSLANNHILDYGYDSLLETLNTLESQNINYAGAGINIEGAMRPTLFEVQGCRIGFLALTDNEPVWEATKDCPGTYFMPISLEDKRYPVLIEYIKRIKAGVDILIIAAHWGPNWGYRPEASHIPFAHSLIDNGADIIFGHSCHVFQGVEVYKNRPIIYSAGDFIDDYAVDLEEPNDQSFIFLIEVHGKKIKGLKLYPIVIKNFQARHAKGETMEAMVNHMKLLCEEFNTIIQWDTHLQCLDIQVI